MKILTQRQAGNREAVVLFSNLHILSPSPFYTPTLASLLLYSFTAYSSIQSSIFALDTSFGLLLLPLFPSLVPCLSIYTIAHYYGSLFSPDIPPITGASDLNLPTSSGHVLPPGFFGAFLLPVVCVVAGECRRCGGLPVSIRPVAGVVGRILLRGGFKDMGRYGRQGRSPLAMEVRRRVVRKRGWEVRKFEEGILFFAFRRKVNLIQLPTNFQPHCCFLSTWIL